MTTKPKNDADSWRFFRWVTIREPARCGSFRYIWHDKYPSLRKRYELGIKGNLTYAEKLFMMLLLPITYASLGYIVRGYFLPKRYHTQFIEFYVFARFILVFVAFWISFPDWLETPVAVIVAWTASGAFLTPLRSLFIDRYSDSWSVHSFNRSLIFILVNYCEILIGFAYLYKHLNLVGYSSCSTPITKGWEAIYFSAVTLTTLGFGDIVPINSFGRVLAAVEPVLGVIVVVVIIGLFFVEIGKRQRA